MVYLALTSNAAQENVELARRSGAAVWVGADGLTDAEYNRLGESGLNISRFVYPLNDADPLIIEQSIATVLQHHPNETVWVERTRAP